MTDDVASRIFLDDRQHLVHRIQALSTWVSIGKISSAEFAINSLDALVIQPQEYWPEALAIIPDETAALCLETWRSNLNGVEFRPDVQPVLALGLTDLEEEYAKRLLEPAYRLLLEQMKARCSNLNGSTTSKL